MSTANGERATINKLFAAYIRLTQLGWRSAFYAPRDGTPIEVLEAASTGIHTGYRDENGSFWINDAGDSWPSMPVLFRPKATQGQPQHEDTSMSWSKSASGSREQVRDTMSKWADEQKATDAGYSNSPGTAEGHSEQIATVVETVGKFTTLAPDGAAFSVSANGHHNGTPSSDQASVTVSYYVPTKTE